MASPAPSLSATDRGFLREAAHAVFGNPFDPGRQARLARLGPGLGSADFARTYRTLAEMLQERLRPYAVDGRVGLETFSGEERPAVETALLYLAYHRLHPDFDRLIEAQAGGLDDDRPLLFGDRAIADLKAVGFAPDDAVRYFAFFFQLRRAFYFIDRNLIGAAKSMQQLRFEMWNAVFTHDLGNYRRWLWQRMEDFSTLLVGATGTGKGSAAAAIGRSAFIPYLPDKRRFAANFTKAFIAINLSQYPVTLIESELFGHRKGAFTGAVEHHRGVFELCSPYGALFLDEIGEVDVTIQIKLLQVLQERAFSAVGSHDRQRFAGRVVAATNRPLAELLRAGCFREDFFYRLCSHVIRVPTLRERIEADPTELERLVQVLVARMVGEDMPEICRSVMAGLRAGLPKGYPWPGNVRELEQAVRRILLTGRYDGGPTDDAASAEDRLAADLRAGTLSSDELVGRYCAMLYDRHGSYVEVSRRTGQDRRTARKQVLAWSGRSRAERG